MSNFNKVDLKLVDDETAANVREKMAEKLSRERAQKLYHGLCCTYCKLVGDSVTLSQHVNKQYVLHLSLRLSSQLKQEFQARQTRTW